MRFSTGFFKTTAVCAILSGVTTLGVHLLPPANVAAMTFEQRVALHAHAPYIFRHWVVLLHILLVVISMWGVAARRLNTSAGLMGLGLMGFLLFAFAELLRTSIMLFGVNRAWRGQYARETSETIKAMLHTNLVGWAGVSDALFFLLLSGLVIGNLLYGSVLLRRAGLERTVGVILLGWSAITLNDIARDYAGVSFAPESPGWFAWTYQPLARSLIGVWLWRSAGGIIVAPPEE